MFLNKYFLQFYSIYFYFKFKRKELFNFKTKLWQILF